jgi:hypothetical protein
VLCVYVASKTGIKVTAAFSAATQLLALTGRYLQNVTLIFTLLASD